MGKELPFRPGHRGGRGQGEAQKPPSEQSTALDPSDTAQGPCCPPGQRTAGRVVGGWSQDTEHTLNTGLECLQIESGLSLILKPRDQADLLESDAGFDKHDRPRGGLVLGDF